MGTQWATRGRDPDDEEFGLRSAYRPRHAKSGRRQQSRRGYPGGSFASQGAAGPLTVTSCETYGYAPVSVRQVLRDRAATFVREHSRRFGDEEWSP